MNMRELKQDALESLKEAIENEYYDDIQDGIHELADGCIPVYNSDLLELCQDDLWLGYMEDWHVREVTDIYQLIQWNVYTELTSYLYQELEGIDECNLCERHTLTPSEVYPEMCQACYENTEEYQEDL